MRRVQREACLVAGSSAGGRSGPACSELPGSSLSPGLPPRRSRSETGRSRGGTRSIRWRPDEIAEAARIVRESRSLGASYRFGTIALAEPPKPALRGYETGAPCPREAAVVLMDRSTGHAYEAIVDFGAAAVRSYDQVPAGLQPSITLEECIECEEAIKRSPDFLAALQKRGVTDPDLVMVDAWSAGTYGDERPEELGKRLVRALAFVRSEPSDNAYARPLDGVTAVVDLHKMEVVRVDDHGVVPLPPEASNWAGAYLPEARSDLKPLAITQPEGPSFTVDGYEVSWQKWTFRIGYTPREGLVLHRSGTATATASGRSWTAPRSVRWSSPTATRPRNTSARTPSTSASTASALMANSLVLGLRLPRLDPLLRRPPLRRPGPAGDDQERGLPARGGRRRALEAHRRAD